MVKFILNQHSLQRDFIIINNLFLPQVYGFEQDNAHLKQFPVNTVYIPVDIKSKKLKLVDVPKLHWFFVISIFIQTITKKSRKY